MASKREADQQQAGLMTSRNTMELASQTLPGLQNIAVNWRLSHGSNWRMCMPCDLREKRVVLFSELQLTCMHLPSSPLDQVAWQTQYVHCPAHSQSLWVLHHPYRQYRPKTKIGNLVNESNRNISFRFVYNPRSSTNIYLQCESKYSTPKCLIIFLENLAKSYQNIIGYSKTWFIGLQRNFEFFNSV